MSITFDGRLTFFTLAQLTFIALSAGNRNARKEPGSDAARHCQRAEKFEHGIRTGIGRRRSGGRIPLGYIACILPQLLCIPARGSTASQGAHQSIDEQNESLESVP